MNLLVRLTVLATATAVAAGLGGPVAADRAEKQPLHRFVDKECGGEDVGPRPEGADGYATFRLTSRDEIVSRVVLKQARPNLRYNVRLVQAAAGGAECLDFDGVLLTNEQGRGAVTIREAKTADGVVFVYVSYPEFGGEQDGDFYSSPSVLIE
jgi:hypothetical protein